MAVNNAYKNSIDLVKRLFTIKTKLIACDMHPEYFSTKFAKSYAQDNDLPLVHNPILNPKSYEYCIIS